MGARAAASVFIAALLAACAAAPEQAARSGESEAASTSIPIRVIRPEGAGPFPAVVVLHDCSGLGIRSSGSPARWGKFLVEQGYVVLIPDSFTTRGLASGVCTDPSPRRLQVAPNRRVRDAYEALDYARTLPYVDPARVAVMGGSHGGASTLATIVAQRRDARAGGFAAAVALYPGCGARYGDWSPASGEAFKPLAPLLILVGELDDWTPAAPCEALAQRAQAAGYPVRIKVYPGAQHAFDSAAPVRYRAERVNGNAPGGRGATTGGHPDAWRDALSEVGAFLARHLKAPRS